jgi:hypothetical protein
MCSRLLPAGLWRAHCAFGTLLVSPVLQLSLDSVLNTQNPGRGLYVSVETRTDFVGSRFFLFCCPPDARVAAEQVKRRTKIKDNTDNFLSR